MTPTELLAHASAKHQEPANAPVQRRAAERTARCNRLLGAETPPADAGLGLLIHTPTSLRPVRSCHCKVNLSFKK